jgi:tetratricopeptide (TPR) repeat protein
LIQAISPHGDLSQNLAFFKQAASYQAPGLQEVREQLAQAASQIASSKEVPAELKQQMFALGVDEMVKQSNASPLDARFPLFLGIMFSSYGDMANAQKALSRAHELSPTKQGILFQQAAVAEAQGDNVTTLQLLKTAFDLAPEYRDARLYYAAALIRAKQDAQADLILAPLIDSGNAADPRVAAAYASRNMYDKIAVLWTAHVAKNPDDMQGYFTLAAAYSAAGNKQQAIATLEAAVQQNPAIASQAEEFIKQIRSGK